MDEPGTADVKPSEPVQSIEVEPPPKDTAAAETKDEGGNRVKEDPVADENLDDDAEGEEDDAPGRGKRRPPLFLANSTKPEEYHRCLDKSQDPSQERVRKLLLHISFIAS